MYQRFGLNVKKYRRLRKMSQDDLAFLSKMGRPTIASIEKGRQAVALHQVMKLAEALDLEMATLLSGISEKASLIDLSGLHETLSARDLEIVEQLQEELR